MGEQHSDNDQAPHGMNSVEFIFHCARGEVVVRYTPQELLVSLPMSIMSKSGEVLGRYAADHGLGYKAGITRPYFVNFKSETSALTPDFACTLLGKVAQCNAFPSGRRILSAEEEEAIMGRFRSALAGHAAEDVLPPEPDLPVTHRWPLQVGDEVILFERGKKFLSFTLPRPLDEKELEGLKEMAGRSQVNYWTDGQKVILLSRSFELSGDRVKRLIDGLARVTSIEERPLLTSPQAAAVKSNLYTAAAVAPNAAGSPAPAASYPPQHEVDGALAGMAAEIQAPAEIEVKDESPPSFASRNGNNIGALVDRLKREQGKGGSGSLTQRALSMAVERSQSRGKPSR